MNHFEPVGTLDNKVLGFGMETWHLPWTDLQPHPFGFLMSKIRVLQRLLHGILSSSLIKSVFDESPRIASGLGRSLECSVWIFY